MDNKKRVSLVLGSGGARGLTHIGVIRWLEENHMEIASVSGSSVGALVGGIYAAGKLDEFEQWVRAITRTDMVNLMDIAWDRSGLIKGDKIINTLIGLVGEQHIEDLPVSFTAVACDIKSEREVWLNRGRLFDAIRASISLPMFFTPFKWHGRTLIDGGVLNPVPIAPTFGDRTDITIAVNLGGAMSASELEHSGFQPGSILVPEPASQALHEKITRYFRVMGKRSAGKSERDWSAYEVANQAFDAMQSTIARQKLAAYPPDLVIEVPKNACGTLEFDRADEMIQMGYRKADKALASLRVSSPHPVVIPGSHEIY
ncbi:patatin-like phospholipase family protein [Oceanospirillum sp. D5]|uniref:Patatin-like phospholipase family protein n=1 Tax=Oceanospirillum sediminis TaxID=2760088 RepID=A0A839IPX0_9GAMM|nr:patatin-like phospholipase family protein [Oceanospirillum sediminis]